MEARRIYCPGELACARRRVGPALRVVMRMMCASADGVGDRCGVWLWTERALFLRVAGAQFLRQCVSCGCGRRRSETWAQ